MIDHKTRTIALFQQEFHTRSCKSRTLYESLMKNQDNEVVV